MAVGWALWPSEGRYGRRKVGVIASPVGFWWRVAWVGIVAGKREGRRAAAVHRRDCKYCRHCVLKLQVVSVHWGGTEAASTCETRKGCVRICAYNVPACVLVCVYSIV